MKFLSKVIFRSPLYPTTKKIKENDQAFFEGLYLSTPTLYKEYQKHLNKSSEASDKIKKSLYKYQSRASNRCTPFGLFAGIGIGCWGDKNEIELSASLGETLVRTTRIDMNVLCMLTQQIADKEYIKPYLKFYPNTSIYKVGNTYRYIEYYYKNNKRYHNISSVDCNPYLTFILENTQEGKTINELVDFLVDDQITKEEAIFFINELIESQLLTNDLEANLTGEDYFKKIFNKVKEIVKLNKNKNSTELLNVLEKVNKLINKIDSKVLNSIKTYETIHIELKKIIANLTETNLLQTDLFKEAISNSVDKEIKNELERTLLFLNKITPVIQKNSLTNFIKRFRDRYEDNEVSLLTALDTEIGVGYLEKDIEGINELIEGLRFNFKNSESEIKWNTLQSHLLKLIVKATKENKKVIKISDNDFKDIDFTKKELPTSMAALFKVVEASTNKIHFKGAGGSSAINILGRFGLGNKDLHSVVTEIATFEQEQFPDKILAEIIHLPESRTGNILARSSFRDYEIPYLAKSSLKPDFQIKMENLFIKVRRNRVILFDKKLQKEIIPRLGNAHNYSYNSLPVYHFLCDLQSQYFEKSYVGFNWGVLARQFEFLPRVEFNSTILSSARWQIRKEQYKELLNKDLRKDERYDLFFNFKNKLELPNKFLIIEGDNELLIDVEKEIAIDTFLNVIKNREEIILEEYLFSNKDALITNTNGNHYTNECVAIILNGRKNKEQVKDNIKEKVNQSKIKQSFTIGSEWLYYKIYTGVKTSDFVLIEKIKKITEKLLEKKAINHWFFIRYIDSDYHLRVRFRISNLQLIGSVIQYINDELEPLIKQDLVSKIQVDTYIRELERYGKNTIEHAEELFCYDSIFVTNFLSEIDLESGNTIRWQMAIRSVDVFLNDFGYNLKEKFQLVTVLSTMFFEEHGGGKALKVSLDRKYRFLQPLIENILNENGEKEYYSVLKLLEVRSMSNIKVIQQIKLIYEKGELAIQMNDLVASFLHMNLDRLFMGRNRTNEFIVYEMLKRYYKSKIARMMYQKKAANNNYHFNKK
ncbi:lantibiotic dehydratase [Tenacibaculum xiamenense]|uniref:lantibiotic dehydratase n=1 Tax=Tenacibaculum xiamenense TaxID=1261553 RepID=UPI00389595FB